MMSSVLNVFNSRQRQTMGLVIVFLTAILVGAVPPVRAADNVFNDLIRSTLSPVVPNRQDIAIVAITEDTLLEEAYRSPINRELLAQILTDLEQHQPSILGIDIILDKPTETEPDEALIQALSSLQTPRVLASIHDASQQTLFEQRVLADSVIASPYLSADGFDGVVRKVTVQTGDMPGFAAALAALVGVKAPDRDQPFRVFRGAENRLPFRIIPAHRLPDIPVNSGWLRDRIVLVGAILDEEDRHATSLRFASEDSRLPGVVVHAYQLAHLLDGAPRTQVPGSGVLVYLILFLLAGALLGAKVRPFWIWGFLAIGVLVLPVVIGVLFYVTFGWTVPVLTPMLMAGLAALESARQSHAQLARRLAYVREAFGRYMDPEIVDRLVADQDQSFAEAKSGEAVFLFTDINDFTGFVRRHAPATVKATLDEYIELVAATIQKHGGTVDRFVGDGVHAFFGMPVPIELVREKAWTCALELVDETVKFQKQLADEGVEFGATRIALHAGTALFGDFGGARHADFTAHGDAVNLTARLLEYGRDQKAVLCATEEALMPGFDMTGWLQDERVQLRSIERPHIIYCLEHDEVSKAVARLSKIRRGV
ncbi:MAG: adenylate/guanylate cyclase domain-containing protein [Henriciella sp.]|nr:adenylate/guanylate cyclase domain-containing protein [Henriciella sp.]